jgi:hypothetical protein
VASTSPGVAALDRVEAILRNPEIYKLAALIPQPSREKGGRGRDFPDFMYLVFEASSASTPVPGRSRLNSATRWSGS